MLANTRTGYGLVAILLHWVMALGIFGMFGLGLYLLDVAKARLALALEELADRAAKPLLDHVIGIDEGDAQPPGELAPDGGFA